jgi:hypothetical protein
LLPLLVVEKKNKKKTVRRLTYNLILQQVKKKHKKKKNNLYYQTQTRLDSALFLVTIAQGGHGDPSGHEIPLLRQSASRGSSPGSRDSLSRHWTHFQCFHSAMPGALPLFLSQPLLAQ